MRTLVLLLSMFLLAVSAIARADISAGDLPSDTVWYLHADLSAMRETDAGRQIYDWLDGEVIVDLNEEFEVDLNKEIDRFTAFSNDGSGIVAIVEGRLSQDLRDKILGVARRDGDLESFEHRGKTYYRAGDEDSATKINENDEIRHAGYFTLDIPGKIVLASQEAQLRELIDSDGVLTGAGRHDNALFVLSADKQFVQAGMRTAEFADDDGDWSSNILRNTEQAAMLISDVGGLIAVQAKLISKDPAMTQSLGSIVNGVIALQAFSTDLDPQVAEILRNTKVEIDGAVLAVSTVLDPAAVVRTLGN